MSLLKSIKAQLGLSVTPANNFTLDASADNGTMKLARGNAGATTQDILTVDAAGKVSFPQGVSVEFESAEQIITANGTAVAVPHSLGATPKRVQVVLRCVTADLGFAVGDEMQLSSNWGSEGGVGTQAYMIWSNATQVGISIRSLTGAPFVNKTGTYAVIVAANWKFVFKAWK